MANRRFLADRMLMRLARWLRMLGQDVSNPPSGDDLDLMRTARSEKRILITRDGSLAQRCSKAGVDCTLIRSTILEDQLREVQELGVELKLQPERCTLCNGKLSRTVPEEMRPSHLETGNPMWICESCGKLYWRGSHWERIRETLNKIRG